MNLLSSLKNLLRDYQERRENEKREFDRRTSIRLHLIRLGPHLVSRFGMKDHYTPEEVQKAAQEADLPPKDLRYGLSIHCTPEDFDAFCEAGGDDYSYAEVRAEVAALHFQGNVAFTPQDVSGYAHAHSQAAMHSHSHAGADGGGGHHSAGFDGGGHSGGFDGGGGGHH